MGTQVESAGGRAPAACRPHRAPPTSHSYSLLRKSLVLRMADPALEAALEIKLRQAELAVMYQNRAASHERMERWAEATSDCDLSIKNNNKYGKALDRRSKLHRKQALLQGGG